MSTRNDGKMPTIKALRNSLAIIFLLILYFFSVPLLHGELNISPHASVSEVLKLIYIERVKEWSTNMGVLAIGFLTTYTAAVLIVGSSTLKVCFVAALFAIFFDFYTAPYMVLEDILAKVSGKNGFAENTAIIAVTFSILFCLYLSLARKKHRTLARVMAAIYLSAALISGTMFHVLLVHIGLNGQSKAIGDGISEQVNLNPRLCQEGSAEGVLFECWSFSSSEDIDPNEIVENDHAVSGIIEFAKTVPEIHHSWISSAATFKNPKIAYWSVMKEQESVTVITTTYFPSIIRDWASMSFNVFVTVFIFVWWTGIQCLLAYHGNKFSKRSVRSAQTIIEG